DIPTGHRTAVRQSAGQRQRRRRAVVLDLITRLKSAGAASKVGRSARRRHRPNPGIGCSAIPVRRSLCGVCRMSVSAAPVRFVRRGFGETARRDLWWVQPLVVVLGFSAFIAYSTWAAFQADHYTSGPYLSPFYSPEIFGNSPHSWFGPKP